MSKKLFINLFKGRKDCFGLNQMCLKEELTDEVYDKHLKGFQRIGIYPIVDKKFVSWMACDIDEHDFSKALAIKNRAEHHGLKSYIERSKSKGYHVWTFFDKPIEAVKVRLVFEMLLEECEFVCELFPKQDEVGETQFGNFIFLPLFGGSIRSEKTIFVDESDKPLIINISELIKININNIKVIEDIIEVNELKRRLIAPKQEGGFQPLLKTPPCIEYIKNNGVQVKQRNAAAFRMAIYYKQRNIPREDVLALLAGWNLKNTKSLPEKELTTVIDSVFKNNYKAFSCEEATLAEYCDKETCPIIESHDRKKNIEEGIITMTYRDENVIVFRKKKYEFRLAGFEFTKSGKFKSSVTLSKDKKVVHKDIINLDMASHRTRFIKAAGDPTLNEDLITIEELVRRQIEKEEKERILKSKQVYVMTEQEKEEALSFLETTPNILAKVIKVTDRLGLVGEETLRLMVYLCFTSRIIDEPLSITIKGEASSGKSFTCQTVQKIVPEEGFHFITRATAQAFYHLPEDGLQHKIIYINELPGSESADYSIRSAQSEGDLVLMMPIKDPHSGDMETKTKRVKGPAGFMITTTKAQMFNENETRNFSLFSDDSPQLTKRIREITIRKAEGTVFKLDAKETNLWKNIQRLLNPEFKVIIPYARKVFAAFPDKPVRIRRDQERFRVLIEIVTILHQFHRKQEKANDDGKIRLVSTLADYYMAKMIAGDILTYTIYEVGPAAEQLWKSIQEMEEDQPQCIREEEEFTFRYKDIAEFIGWRVEKVKKWIHSLTQLGLIDYADVKGGGKGGRGKASLFRINKAGAEFSHQALGFLPNVADLFDEHPCDEELFYNPMTGEKVDVQTAEIPAGLLEGTEEEEYGEEKGKEEVQDEWA